MTDHLDPHRLVRLRGCHPDLQSRVLAIISDLVSEGHDPVITQGVRTTAQQQAIYAQGRSRVGKVVTDCDGVKRVSNHQKKPDGYGYAVDLAWRVNGEIIWEGGPWDRLGELAVANGLRWGGLFTTLINGQRVPKPDRPHLELPPSSSAPTVARA